MHTGAAPYGTGSTRRAMHAPIGSASECQPRYLSARTRVPAGSCRVHAARAHASAAGHSPHSAHAGSATRPVRSRGAPQRAHPGEGTGRNRVMQRAHTRRRASCAPTGSPQPRQTAGRSSPAKLSSTRRMSTPRNERRTRTEVEHGVGNRWAGPCWRGTFENAGAKALRCGRGPGVRPRVRSLRLRRVPPAWPRAGRAHRTRL